nr:MAG TPA: hypothetical protein [Caudoviricetes sp.]
MNLWKNSFIFFKKKRHVSQFRISVNHEKEKK